MHAIRIHQHGGPEMLKWEELPTPEPGPGKVRVRLEAIGVNFADVYYREGHYKTTLPATLGREGAGVVDALGPGVSEFKLGDRVAFAMEPDTYAEYAVVSPARLVPVPARVSSPQAAAVLLQGLTAHYLAKSTYPLQSGDTALVLAAAGGTGQLLVQIAKLCGARVIGAVSTEEKAEVARRAGADEIILYSQIALDAEVKRLTDGQGVDVVYDSVGRDTFHQSLNCLKRRHMLVLYGQSSGPVPPFDPQILNAKGSLFLTRPGLAAYVADREELLWRARDLFSWLEQGQLRVNIARTFPLAQAADAHRFLESRAALGKILLQP